MASRANPPCKKARRASTGMRGLEVGLEFLEDAQRKNELDYVISQLKGPRKDMVCKFAAMLRNMPQDTSLGTRLCKEKVRMKFGQLPGQTLAQGVAGVVHG